jgi:hypothetical protein
MIMPVSLVLALVRSKYLTRSGWGRWFCYVGPLWFVGGMTDDEPLDVRLPDPVVTRRNGRMVAALGFTITHGKIVAIEVLADPERLTRLDSVAGYEP